MCILRGHLPAAYDLRMSGDARISSCGLSRRWGGNAYLRLFVWLVVRLFAAGAGEGTLPAELPSLVDRGLRLARVDFDAANRPPSGVRVIVALVVSVIGSLATDALLVTIGQAVFPSTKGYGHFQFSDYAKLTVIGVVIACVAWPIVTRISSAPRWLFFRMAIAVTLALWLPDLYILAKGQPVRAVAVLMVMHLAIAVVTYTCL